MASEAEVIITVTEKVEGMNVLKYVAAMQLDQNKQEELYELLTRFKREGLN